MTNSPRAPEPQPVLNESPKPKRMGWLLYFGIAFFIAIWTALGGLFFLAVVWVLRMKHSPEASFILSKDDQKTAHRVYTWLFFSSIITVPIFIAAVINLSYKSTINERVFAALIPLIIHVPLFLGLTSKSVFVYRHTQQGILLIALRAGMASIVAVNVQNHSEYALTLFFLGNGLLWLFGSLIGWSQISNKECWFMNYKGEKILLPEAIHPPKNDTALKDKELNEMLKSFDAPGMTTARQKAMHAFRTGTPEMKKRAVAVLTQLGEVEKF